MCIITLSDQFSSATDKQGHSSPLRLREVEEEIRRLLVEFDEIPLPRFPNFYMVCLVLKCTQETKNM